MVNEQFIVRWNRGSYAAKFRELWRLSCDTKAAWGRWFLGLINTRWNPTTRGDSRHGLKNKGRNTPPSTFICTNFFPLQPFSLSSNNHKRVKRLRVFQWTDLECYSYSLPKQVALTVKGMLATLFRILAVLHDEPCCRPYHTILWWRTLSKPNGPTDLSSYFHYCIQSLKTSWRLLIPWSIFRL